MADRPRSSYRELPAPEALALYVACLWEHRIGDGGVAYDQPVLPDGCIDLVVLGGNVVLAGPATRPVRLELMPGSVLAGVRFRPGAAPPLLGVSAAELRDLEVPVGDLWGRPGAEIAERSMEAPGPAEQLKVLTDAVAERVGGAAVDPVATGIAAMLARRPAVPVRSLADQVALSERQLRRRVEDAVGYPPRTLARILRFQRFLRLARAVPTGRRDLAGLAAEVGYADQAHLTRESRQLGGLPPGALLDWEARRLGRAWEPPEASGRDKL
jgi:AraC-like DNA-binding protein